MQLSLLDPIPPTPEPSRPKGRCLTREDLHSHVPEASIDFLLEWFYNNPVRLRFAPSRSSKFGDYRSPKSGVRAAISVNNNLNRYDFLITLVHEMAHHVVFSTSSSASGVSLFRRKKDRPKPHGKEWKTAYHQLMIPFMNHSVFPAEILLALNLYFGNPRASAKASQNLAVALKKYDTPDGREFLKDLAQDEIFYIPGGRAFRKKEQLRKRFVCQSLNNRRTYLFSPLAVVSRNNG